MQKRKILRTINVLVFQGLTDTQSSRKVLNPVLLHLIQFLSVFHNPAAMRYTEARTSLAAEDLLGEIDKETVDFQSNYDNALLEPVVLPARFPALLVNGSTGIAVGMSMKIPPHNLGEIFEVCRLL